MKLTRNDEPLDTPVSEIQKEKIPFRSLSFSKKLSYIWDYYKWWIISVTFIILLSINTIPHVIENKKEAVLYSAFVNTQLNGQENTSLMDDFVKSAGINMKNKRIVLDTTMIINRDNADQMSMQSNQKLLALFSSKIVDVVVCDRSNYEFFASKGCFCRLDELLPSDLLNQYKDFLVSAIGGDSQTANYGISLKDSQVLKDEKAYIVEPILGIYANAKQKDNAVLFIKYLLSK